jgi:hypothetical protein
VAFSPHVPASQAMC